MCVNVWFGEERIESVFQLRDKLSSDVVFHEDFEDDGADMCLCNVDIEKTLEQAGLGFDHDEMFDCVVKIEPRV